ncbi:MAG: SpoIID/LytB domain-containing protein [Solirubrobacterales bacterium]
MLRGTRILLAAFACAIAIPASASAKVWVVHGAGFGHGVGMSQYGAYGYAKHGFKYDQILTHYYTGTTIGTTADQAVRVLLRDSAGSVAFHGASSACGVGLAPKKTFVAKRKRAGVVLRSKKGGVIARCGATMTAVGAPTVVVAGKGTYRGSLEVRAASRGLDAINVLDVEDYVRGVVSKESPSSWPIEALKAQAVAARSYVLSTAAHGGSFDVFDDTRSQAYGGVGAETAKSDQAVGATHLQVVLYNGKVAQTFFFSTSGGHTENNEFSSLGFGQPAVPYLRGVDDPYEADAGSPYERWKRKYSLGRMSSALRSVGLRGKLRKIVVIQRGASPRIVRAKLVGSRGKTKVNGPQLASALGLPDTWAFFKKK